jgi:hypothetical protein
MPIAGLAKTQLVGATRQGIEAWQKSDGKN